jgi:hypothetical protein
MVQRFRKGWFSALIHRRRRNGRDALLDALPREPRQDVRWSHPAFLHARGTFRAHFAHFAWQVPGWQPINANLRKRRSLAPSIRLINKVEKVWLTLGPGKSRTRPSGETPGCFAEFFSEHTTGRYTGYEHAGDVHRGRNHLQADHLAFPWGDRFVHLTLNDAAR